MNIRITRMLVDGELLYEATCEDFPDLYEYGETYEEAEALMWDAIDVTMEYLQEGYEE
jgi:predicted RNase H-like HicB family nuclease